MVFESDEGATAAAAFESLRLPITADEMQTLPEYPLVAPDCRNLRVLIAFNFYKLPRAVPDLAFIKTANLTIGTFERHRISKTADIIPRANGDAAFTLRLLVPQACRQSQNQSS